MPAYSCYCHYLIRQRCRLHLRVIALRLLQVVAGHWVARDAPPDGPAAAAKCLCDALPDQHRALLPALVDIVRQRSPLESATAQQSLVRNEAAWDTVLQTCQVRPDPTSAHARGPCMSPAGVTR